MKIVDNAINSQPLPPPPPPVIIRYHLKTPSPSADYVICERPLIKIKKINNNSSPIIFVIVIKGAGGSSSRFPRNRLFSCF